MHPIKDIYLIRHGETDYNRLGVVQGSGIDADLNELGQRQAKAFFDHYHRDGTRGCRRAGVGCRPQTF